MATKPKKSADLVGGVAKVRVLADCIFGKCDDVVELAADQLALAVEIGVVDPDPAAVAYAESLKG